MKLGNPNLLQKHSPVPSATFRRQKIQEKKLKCEFKKSGEGIRIKGNNILLVIHATLFKANNRRGGYNGVL